MQKRAGFSVVELLVVIALMGTIVVVAAGINYNARHRWSMQDFGRDITTSYYQLRQLASRENAPCRMKFSARGFQMYRSQLNGAVRIWAAQPFRTVDLGRETHVYVQNPNLDIGIDSRGYVYQTNDACALNMVGMQSLEIRSPHRRGGGFGDWTQITFYPFGGLDVHKTISQSFH